MPARHRAGAGGHRAGGGALASQAGGAAGGGGGGGKAGACRGRAGGRGSRGRGSHSGQPPYAAHSRGHQGGRAMGLGRAEPGTLCPARLLSLHSTSCVAGKELLTGTSPPSKACQSETAIIFRCSSTSATCPLPLSLPPCPRPRYHGCPPSTWTGGCWGSWRGCGSGWWTLRGRGCSRVGGWTGAGGMWEQNAP